MHNAEMVGFFFRFFFFFAAQWKCGECIKYEWCKVRMITGRWRDARRRRDGGNVACFVKSVVKRRQKVRREAIREGTRRGEPLPRQPPLAPPLLQPPFATFSRELNTTDTDASEVKKTSGVGLNRVANSADMTTSLTTTEPNPKIQLSSREAGGRKKKPRTDDSFEVWEARNRNIGRQF